MHGLINHTIQRFVLDSFGHRVWAQVALRADLCAVMGTADFEPMLTYNDAITPRVINRLSAVMKRAIPDLLEDLGAWLVSNPDREGVRRLLRFGGDDFEEFLHSLNDLPERAILAVEDLQLPQMEVAQLDDWRFTLTCRGKVQGFGYVMMGVMRVIADDYGTLALLDCKAAPPEGEVITVTIIDRHYAQGRSFDLGARG
ncbi:heme NO-binding protein [Sulfitobacter pontiacus]|uniref:heme NO-binding domain-containing protein n=1 Tax=Sulfitobacter pontiacus TaxID=60137 RepID=UPI0007D9701E|nr:heme NO-binding domain-containing protein [Sulfitobacter pontiacus]OAN81932.1 heme NO-binding protein [Sulfitobacter pontiacus]